MADPRAGAPPAAAPPGWYPDPSGRASWRWWTGAQWSWSISDGGPPILDPLATRPVPSRPAQVGGVIAPGTVDGSQTRRPRQPWTRRPSRWSWPLAATLVVSPFLTGSVVVLLLFLGGELATPDDRIVVSFVYFYAALLAVVGLLIAAAAALRRCAPGDRIWSTLVGTLLNLVTISIVFGWLFLRASIEAGQGIRTGAFGGLVIIAAVCAALPWGALWFLTLTGRGSTTRLAAAVSPLLAAVVGVLAWAMR